LEKAEDKEGEELNAIKKLRKARIILPNEPTGERLSALSHAHTGKTNDLWTRSS